MTYNLFCVVNAIGIPYNDTFSANEAGAWWTHRWRDCPKDGEHPNSCKMGTLEDHGEKLKANGDRVVQVKVETNEAVRYEIFP